MRCMLMRLRGMRRLMMWMLVRRRGGRSMRMSLYDSK